MVTVMTGHAVQKMWPVTKKWPRSWPHDRTNLNFAWSSQPSLSATFVTTHKNRVYFYPQNCNSWPHIQEETTFQFCGYSFSIDGNINGLWWSVILPVISGPNVTGHDRSRSRFLVKMTSLKNMTMFMTFRNPDFTFNRLNPSPVDDKRQGRGVWMEAGRYEGRAVVLTAHPPSLTDQMPDGCC